MIKDKVTAVILTIVILYLIIRAFAMIYGVVRILKASEFIPADTIHHNYPELDKTHLRFKNYENNQIKVESRRST